MTRPILILSIVASLFCFCFAAQYQITARAACEMREYITTPNGRIDSVNGLLAKAVGTLHLSILCEMDPSSKNMKAMPVGPNPIHLYFVGLSRNVGGEKLTFGRTDETVGNGEDWEITITRYKKGKYVFFARNLSAHGFKTILNGEFDFHAVEKNMPIEFTVKYATHLSANRSPDSIREYTNLKSPWAKGIVSLYPGVDFGPVVNLEQSGVLSEELSQSVPAQVDPSRILKGLTNQ